jgi:2-polyprenyl-3-methyl-5-hydroxy-6-metoxy-1,4-benzoquinol methylase
MPERGSLLDIGSGPGHFLNIAQNCGWQVNGIEPRKEAVKYCRNQFGIDTYNGFLENYHRDARLYDVVTAWDVLEHVSDHISFLDHILELLKPGGIFSFSIPNASGLPAKIFKGRWRYVMSVHLNYFTMEYMHNLLSTKQLQIIYADHTVKLHSLVQGIATFLPINLNVKKIFIKMNKGSNDTIEKQQHSSVLQSRTFYLKNAVFCYLRDLLYRFNMIRLPFAKGDIVDYYCRKLE